jgi:long-chain acyl-CoA synthetase
MMAVIPLACFLGLAKMVCIDVRYAAGIAEWVTREKIEFLNIAWPTLLDIANDACIDRSMLCSLKVAWVGGGRIPEEALAKIHAKLGFAPTVCYGATEVPGTVSGTNPLEPRIELSSGTAYEHFDLAILDHEGRILPEGQRGEICLRPKSTGSLADVYTPMLGYWEDLAATESALRGGWLHTDDVGYLDAGRLFVQGRRGDMIIRGGSNIHPAEVEKILEEDPRVNAAVVLGKTDPRLGQIVIAVIELKPGVTVEDSLWDSLRDRCEASLARYKVPAEWHSVREFQRNAMRKIIRATVRAQFG